MVTPEMVRDYIAQGLSCQHVQVEGDGRHFDAKRLVARHQLVYKALGDRMREEIHALSMKTLTPVEHAANPVTAQPQHHH
jgi:acid stress-induced BolA-like protein IbaG/YrbA